MGWVESFSPFSCPDEVWHGSCGSCGKEALQLLGGLEVTLASQGQLSHATVSVLWVPSPRSPLGLLHLPPEVTVVFFSWDP